MWQEDSLVGQQGDTCLICFPIYLIEHIIIIIIIEFVDDDARTSVDGIVNYRGDGADKGQDVLLSWSGWSGVGGVKSGDR